MKYYKKEDGSIWAFEIDGSQDSLITTEFTSMTEAEVTTYLTPKVVIPSAITLVQLRLSLLSSGNLQKVKDAIAAMTGTDGDYAREDFDYRNLITRDSTLVTTISTILNLDNTKLDALFVDASTR